MRAEAVVAWSADAALGRISVRARKHRCCFFQ